MAVTREFVKNLPEGPQKIHYQQILDGMMSTDKLTNKLFKDVSILLTSHPGNRPFLRASLESFKKLDYFLLLGYDNYFNPKQTSELNFDKVLPFRDVFDLCDSFFITPYQEWGGVMLPYFFQLYQGVMMLGNYKYILCSNGDCILEKPEGFNKLFETFKESNADIFPISVEENNGRSLLNTTCFIAKTEAIQKMMVHFRDHFLPFENYEKYTEKMGNTERRFYIAAKELGLKVLKPEKNSIDTQVSTPYGTFYDIMGFRHIHAEFNVAYRRRKGMPPEPKYLDDRYMTSKVNIIKQLYNEKDLVKKQQHLENFWASK